MRRAMKAIDAVMSTMGRTDAGAKEKNSE